MTIGQWVLRLRRGQAAHFVESLVSDDAITRCGRRMVPVNADGPLVIAPYGFQKCLRCIDTIEWPDE